MHFVSGSYEGELCAVCLCMEEERVHATHKLGEEIPHDEPCPDCAHTWNWGDPNIRTTQGSCVASYHWTGPGARHNLTAYVCCWHFRMIVGGNCDV